MEVADIGVSGCVARNNCAAIFADERAEIDSGAGAAISVSGGVAGDDIAIDAIPANQPADVFGFASPAFGVSGRVAGDNIAAI